ncbi:hypothetical protein LCGC14_2032330 [marine sediment metagenome]|uniref:Uncharacterized protein n=1 Tax=marine sediment metagenome TaxID=412755 RepID=A0A0F9HR91_9ZZZZ
MADFEYALTKLSIDVSRPADDTTTAVVNFTVAGETYKVTVPAVPHDQIRQLLSRIGYAVSRDQLAPKLAGGDTFSVELIE